MKKEEISKKSLNSDTKIYQDGYIKIENEEEFKKYLNSLRKKTGEPYAKEYSDRCISKLRFAAAHVKINNISATNTRENDLNRYHTELKKVIHYTQRKLLTDEQFRNSNWALKKYNEFVHENSSVRNFKEASLLSSEERIEIINKMPKVPKTKIETITTFIRNEYVKAETINRANGICESCSKPAPFIRKSDRTPYLEVHHKLPLAEGGEDTLENTVGICPHCHRNEHFGNPKWPW